MRRCGRCAWRGGTPLSIYPVNTGIYRVITGFRTVCRQVGEVGAYQAKITVLYPYRLPTAPYRHLPPSNTIYPTSNLPGQVEIDEGPDELDGDRCAGRTGRCELTGQAGRSRGAGRSGGARQTPNRPGNMEGPDGLEELDGPD